MKGLIPATKGFKRTIIFLSFLFSTISQAQAAQINVPGDQPSIQAAVDVAASGDTIMVSNGTYIENIAINKPVIICSENGPDTTFVQALNTSNSVFRINSNNVTIRGFSINGVAVAGPAGVYIASGVQECVIEENKIGTQGAANVYGIYLWEATNNTIANNICQGNSNYGIILYRSNDNIIDNNICDLNGTYGIYLWESAYNTISSNKWRLNSRHGIHMWGSSNNTLSSNTATQNTTRGISLAGSSNRNTITKNNITKNNTAMEVSESDSNKIINNYCEGNTVFAISLSHGSSYNEILNNTCKNHPFASGIQLWESDQNIISKNIVSLNSVGISLQTASANQVFSNVCTKNDDSGISLSANSQYNTIYSNQVSENIDKGLKVYDSMNNRIWDNLCDSNTRGAIGIYSSSNNAISRNTFSNSSYGITIIDSNTNTIYLNNIQDNATNIFSRDSINEWQTIEEVTYSYQGTQFISFLGNFYDNHIWVDLDGNGLTDQPNDLPGTEPNDNHPLVITHDSFILNPGNLDFDAQIDGYDLVLFTVAFESSTTAADLNQDNMVNAADTELFSLNFGENI